MKSAVYGAKQMPLKLFEDVEYAAVISLLGPNFVQSVQNISPHLLINVLLNKQTFRSVQDVFALRVYYFTYSASTAATCNVYG